MEGKNDLFSVYQKCCGSKAEMDGRTFLKCLKDSKLLGGKLTQTDVDLNFAKIAKSIKTLTFDQFKACLELCATKKGVSFDDFAKKIIEESQGGPKFEGTKADYVKFHDDKSTYTGVYAKGGPTNVDTGAGGKISDLSQLADRTKADVRGVKK